MNSFVIQHSFKVNKSTAYNNKNVIVHSTTRNKECREESHKSREREATASNCCIIFADINFILFADAERSSLDRSISSHRENVSKPIKDSDFGGTW